MAETKTKSGGSRRSGTGRPNGSKGSKAGSKANGSGNGSGKAAAEEQVDTPRKTASAVGPALAGGAAVAGLAGAVALALNGRRKGLSLPGVGKKRRRMVPSSLPKPDVSMPSLSKLKGDSGKATRKALGSTTKALGKTAVEVGKAGYRAGELAAEVRRVREQASQRKSQTS